MAKPRIPRVRAKTTDLNLTPIMNLIIILIPALLLSASFVQTAVINVPSPLIAPGIDDSPVAPPETRPLELSLAITGQGFQVAGKGLAAHAGDGPTIPKTGVGYDFPALTEHLGAFRQVFVDLDIILGKFLDQIRSLIEMTVHARLVTLHLGTLSFQIRLQLIDFSGRRSQQSSYQHTEKDAASQHNSAKQPDRFD